MPAKGLQPLPLLIWESHIMGPYSLTPKTAHGCDSTPEIEPFRGHDWMLVGGTRRAESRPGPCSERHRRSKFRWYAMRCHVWRNRDTDLMFDPVGEAAGAPTLRNGDAAERTAPVPAATADAATNA